MREEKENAEEKVRDDLVENALLRRATGYEDAAGKPVPPDVRAAMYWLENRRPDRWCRHRNSSGEDTENINFSKEENLL